MAEGEILVVTPTFHPEKVGTPHYVTDMVGELVRLGYDVRVLTNQPYYPAFERFTGYGRSRRRDQLDGTEVYRLPTIVPRGGKHLWRILSEANLLLQAALARLLRRVDPTDNVVAVSPGVPAAILVGGLLRSAEGRLTVVVHDVGFGLANAAGGALGRMTSRGIRALEVWSLNRADRITVLSDAMGDALRAAGVMVPIETVELWPTVEGSTDPECNTVMSQTVLYSGNLGRKQGVDVLLDLADGLRDRSPGAQVVIRGDGAERVRLERSAADRRLGNVTFEDFVPREQLVMGLAAARVHVVPQLPEGAEFAVPSKVVNILAVGRPVVVTAPSSSPLARLSEECQAVIRVDPGDIDGFCRAVAGVLGAGDREYTRLSTAARAWARSHDRTTAVLRTVGRYE